MAKLRYMERTLIFATRLLAFPFPWQTCLFQAVYSLYKRAGTVVSEAEGDGEDVVDGDCLV